MVRSVCSSPGPTTADNKIPTKHLHYNVAQASPSPATMSGIADMPAVPVVIQPRFSMSSLAALHSSSFAKGFSNGERQAAARALLKHDVHVDGAHYHTREPGGLHPSYVAFNSYMSSNERSITQEEIVKAALQDVFDAVSFLSVLIVIY
jgi:hypothetical protein